MHKLLYSFLIAFLISLEGSAQEKSIIIAADEWCPFNCEVDSKKEGYVVEIIKTIYEPLGYKITYKNYPWLETLSKLEKGEVDIVIGATRNEISNAIFPKQEIGMSEDVYLLRQDDEWRFKGALSLINKKIGVMKGYDYSGTEFGHYVTYKQEMKPNIIFMPESMDISDRLDLLMQKKIDLFVEDKNVILNELNELNRKNDFKIAGTVGATDPLFTAFTKYKIRSKKLVSIFDIGMLNLRKSGRLKKILAKYGMQDWRKQTARR